MSCGNNIAYAAWCSADPGIQYDTTINDWHTCPELRPDQRVESRARNTCSWTIRRATSRRSISSKFRAATDGFDQYRRPTNTRSGYGPSCWKSPCIMAQFPSREIASREPTTFRTLGLGFANIGGLLMAAGHGYDSDEGRAICGALSGNHDRRRLRYLVRRWPGELGRVSGLFEENRDAMLRVIRNHRQCGPQRANRGAIKACPPCQSP